MSRGYLEASTVAEWTKSQTTRDGQETNYGIDGEIFKRDNDLIFYGHSGTSVGGITYFLMHPAFKPRWPLRPILIL